MISRYLLISMLLIGQILRAQENQPNTGLIQAEYFKSMAEVEDEIFQQKFEYPFLVLLEDAQRKQYESLPDLDRKKEYIRWYWKKNNPNPLLPENAWLNLFLARCTYVQIYFPSSQPPYFDDRGKYFLKYGKPELRYQQEGGTKHVQLFSNNEAYKFICKITGPSANFRTEDGWEIPRYYNVFGNETWVYPSADNDPNHVLLLHFIQYGSTFWEAETLEDFIADPREFRFRMWYWSDLLKERAMALGTHALTHAVRKIFAFEDAIYYEAAIHYKTGHNLDIDLEYHTESTASLLAQPMTTLFQQKSSTDSDVRFAKSNAPVSTTASQIVPSQLTFFHRSAQFRDSGNRTRIEFSIISPLVDNLMKDNNDFAAGDLNMEYACLLQDGQANPIIKGSTAQRFPIFIGAQKDLENTVGRIVVTAQPQDTGAVLQVKDVNAKKQGYVKESFSIRDFSGSRLMISDIQLLTEIPESIYEEALPVFEKENLKVAPYPYPEISISYPVYCYFEIYNLYGNVPSGEYVIELMVRTKRNQGIFKKLTPWPSNESKESISLAHTRIVDEDTARELISVDFSSLDPDDYCLEISVKDAHNEYINASAQKDISIHP